MFVLRDNIKIPALCNIMKGASASAAVVDPLFKAHAAYRRRDFASCIALVDRLLEANPADQAAWLLKCRAITEQARIDDALDFEEGELLSDVVLQGSGDGNRQGTARPGTGAASSSTVLRPGTSMARPGTGSSPAFRPMSSSGRPMTGFSRPGTSSRPDSASLRRGGTASGGASTARLTTALGRQLRLGTAAAMLSSSGGPGGPLIDVSKLDVRKAVARPAIAKALMLYLLYIESNANKAVELGSAATVAAKYSDPWWKEALGVAYLMLELPRDAEKQLQSAYRQQEMISTGLQLAKTYVKLRQPNAAKGASSEASLSIAESILVCACNRSLCICSMSCTPLTCRPPAAAHRQLPVGDAPPPGRCCTAGGAEPA